MTSRREFLEVVAGAGVLGGLLGGCSEAGDRLAALLLPEESVVPRVPGRGEIDAIAHLLNRLTWGARPEDRAKVEAIGAEGFIEQQLDPESIDDRRCAWRIAEIESLAAPRGELYEFSPAQLRADLVRARLLRALHSRRQLHELMVEFWSDHFNIAVSKGDCRWMKVADDREVVRPHAMGRFADLLRASLLSPAMLISLDGADNRVLHPDERPNENHARELLELHTLGVHGGYTQKDVLETARCLSGWTFTHDWRRLFTARVAFDPRRHDDGSKQVLGRAIPAGGGADDIERLVELLATHPGTARHLASKLVRFFVADPPPERLTESVSETFLGSSGAIVPALRAIFTSAEFMDSRGTLLKRPMRYVLSALRALDVRSDCGPALIAHLERMGHAPFAHATPEGYPLDAQPWLGTLLWRWSFALELARGQLAGATLDLGALARRLGSVSKPRVGQRARLRPDGKEVEAGGSYAADADRRSSRPAVALDASAVLRQNLGGSEALASHLLGRTPSAEERELLTLEHPDAVALALASPAFQLH
jgi:uncharacterized protein (DUF1800 family)